MGAAGRSAGITPGALRQGEVFGLRHAARRHHDADDELVEVGSSDSYGCVKEVTWRRASWTFPFHLLMPHAVVCTAHGLDENLII
jgi:hypothetical protein